MMKENSKETRSGEALQSGLLSAAVALVITAAALLAVPAVPGLGPEQRLPLQLLVLAAGYAGWELGYRARKVARAPGSR